jgi:hypothetical protein
MIKKIFDFQSGWEFNWGKRKKKKKTQTTIKTKMPVIEHMAALNLLLQSCVGFSCRLSQRDDCG